jgi:hypothetical protein
MLCGDIMLSSELLDAVHSLSAEDRASLLGYLHSLRAPKAVDEKGQTRNPRRLTLIDRRSILYLSKFAEPKATPTELAAIFGVSQQRVSQILGARGHKSPDAALINAFNNTRPSDLRDGWLNLADLERLNSFRAGKIAESPVSPRNMTSAADPLGRWSAYGYTFSVFERDGLFYFVIDGDEGDESKPRNSASQALADCIRFCRDDAWTNSDGNPNSWSLLYGEDPFAPAKSANAVRIGGL